MESIENMPGYALLEFDGESFEFADRGGGVYELPMDLIYRNEEQPRSEFNAEQMTMLSESIRTHGVLQPITVTTNGKGSFLLVAGERRYRAAMLVGLRTIPARIETRDAQQRDGRLWLQRTALMENMQRRSLNSHTITIDILQHLANAAGLGSIDQVIRLLRNAKRGATLAHELEATETIKHELFSLGVAWLTFLNNNVRLVNLPRDLIAPLDAGRINAATALELAQEPDARRRERYLRKTIDENLASKDVRRLIKSARSATNNKAPPAKSAARTARAAPGDPRTQIRSIVRARKRTPNKHNPHQADHATAALERMRSLVASLESSALE